MLHTAPFIQKTHTRGIIVFIKCTHDEAIDEELKHEELIARIEWRRYVFGFGAPFQKARHCHCFGPCPRGSYLSRVIFGQWRGYFSLRFQSGIPIV